MWLTVDWVAVKIKLLIVRETRSWKEATVQYTSLQWDNNSRYKHFLNMYFGLRSPMDFTFECMNVSYIGEISFKVMLSCNIFQREQSLRMRIMCWTSRCIELRYAYWLELNIYIHNFLRSYTLFILRSVINP